MSGIEYLTEEVKNMLKFPALREDLYLFILFYAHQNSWKYRRRHHKGYTVSELEKVAEDLGFKNCFSKSRTAYSVFSRLEMEKNFVRQEEVLWKKRKVKVYLITNNGVAYIRKRLIEIRRKTLKRRLPAYLSGAYELVLSYGYIFASVEDARKFVSFQQTYSEEEHWGGTFADSDSPYPYYLRLIHKFETVTGIKLLKLDVKKIHEQIERAEWSQSHA